MVAPIGDFGDRGGIVGEHVGAEEPPAGVAGVGADDHLLDDVHTGVVDLDAAPIEEAEQVAQSTADVEQALARQVDGGDEDLESGLLAGGVGPVVYVVALPLGRDPRLVVAADDPLPAHGEGSR